MMSVAASLGLILLWDIEGGLSEIDNFLYTSQDHIKVNLAWYWVLGYTFQLLFRSNKMAESSNFCVSIVPGKSFF